MPKVPLVGVTAIVINKEGLVLMGQRIKQGSLGQGKWQFPGGLLEHGESPIEGAARELLEETGMTVVSAKQGPYISSIFKGPKGTEAHFIDLFVEIRAEGIPVNKEPDRCAGWSWVFWKGILPERVFLPTRKLWQTDYIPEGVAYKEFGVPT